MKYVIDGETYNIEILKKGNRNTYLRIKDDLTIQVSTSRFISDKKILEILHKNEDAIRKLIFRKKKELEKMTKFYYLGQVYDIIIVPSYENVEIDGKRIYVKSAKELEKWYKNEMCRIFESRVDEIYHRFEEDIPYPKIKMRNMKTRWGVCNRKDNSITLNTKLMWYDLTKLDYVIVHELSHFVHFDHSKAFWDCVSKYCPDYKMIRKELKE